MFKVSRIRVESRTPKWGAAELRFTRLKDPVRGIILIFKELSWQTVRIEASSTQDKNLTPLRLLTNQAKCRITIKKKLSGKLKLLYSTKTSNLLYYIFLSQIVVFYLQDSC